MVGEPLRVFVGWDSREPIAFSVAVHSILSRAGAIVSIIPLTQAQLRVSRVYTRDVGKTESTEFSLTRFLCPYLSGFDGHSIFVDCDVLVLCDIYELLAYALAFPDKAVLVAQHNYVPKDTKKFLGNVQTVYERKNWSSVMVFNNALCGALTPDYVNTATGLELHRFKWCENEKIGSIPLSYNWLVGEYEQNPNAKILHYTLGGPYFPEYANCDHAKEWFAERDAMLGVK